MKPLGKVKNLEQPLKLDFGCGPNKKSGFIGVDIIEFPNVDIILDIGNKKWPWKDSSVEEAHASHFVEHLTSTQRIHFCNELYRVLKVGSSAQIITPHWASCRAYGDPTHVWPPVSEFWFYYLSRDWRASNAPHTDIKFWKDGYDCDFEVTWAYNLHQSLINRNQDFQANAMQFYKEAAQDTIANFKKR